MKPAESTKFSTNKTTTEATFKTVVVAAALVAVVVWTEKRSSATTVCSTYAAKVVFSLDQVSMLFSEVFVQVNVHASAHGV